MPYRTLSFAVERCTSFPWRGFRPRSVVTYLTCGGGSKVRSLLLFLILNMRIQMNLQENSGSNSLDKVYLEASQWVRLANTIVWSMGTLLVPVSFGFVGLALNKISGAQFEGRGKAVLAIGSIFLFSFWVYASRIYRRSSIIAREVLIEIEHEWKVKGRMSLYELQMPLVKRRLGLFPLQIVTLVALVLVWLWILCLDLWFSIWRRNHQPSQEVGSQINMLRHLERHAIDRSVVLISGPHSESDVFTGQNLFCLYHAAPIGFLLCAIVLSAKGIDNGRIRIK